MMNTFDIRKSINAINEGVNNTHKIVVLESDFVSSDTELTDTQIKQIFMIMGQATEYKKEQKNLNGYVPSIQGQQVGDTGKDRFRKVKNKAKAAASKHFGAAKDYYKSNKQKSEAPINEFISEDEILNELDPFGNIAKMKNDFMAKFGDDGSKMAIDAKEAAQTIWQNWSTAKIKTGMSSTVESLGKWIKNLGFEEDIIDIAFRAIGVPNIKSTLRKTTTRQALPLDQWMGENGVTPGSLDANKFKDYMLDNDVKKEDLDKILAQLNIKNNTTMFKSEQAKTGEKAVATYVASLSNNEEPEEPEEPEENNDVGKKPNGAWSAKDIHKYAINTYNIDAKTVHDILVDYGVTGGREDDPVGDVRIKKIMSSIKDDSIPDFAADSLEGSSNDAPSNPDERMKTTQTYMKQAGGSVNGAVSRGKKAKESGDFTSYSELAKLGMAVLTARRKI